MADVGDMNHFCSGFMGIWMGHCVTVLECACPAEDQDVASRLNTGAREVNKLSLSNVAAHGKTAAALPQPLWIGQRDLFFFLSLHSYCFGRRRISILPLSNVDLIATSALS